MSELDSNRDPFEHLAADFMERCRRGESPSLEGYVRQHPDLTDEIRELFPTIAALENLKDAGTSCATRGPVTDNLQLERLGDFRIIRELGRGGMGIVYEAEQESLGRSVALKVLPRQMLLDDIQLERFEREARTAANLHHTNIVPIFGVGSHEGYHYYAMQYIRGVGLDVVSRELRRMFRKGRTDSDGAPLDQGDTTIDALSIARSLARDASRVHAHVGQASSASPSSSSMPTRPCAGRAERPFGKQSAGGSTREYRSDDDTPPALQVGTEHWRGIARIALQVADACEYAHQKGTLHRDIKPGNLLIDANGIVWVADFGLAKALDQDGVTQTGGMVGTLRYMAPEQFKGKSDVRSDIYSMGLTLYELATLRPAFMATGKTTLIDAIMHGQPQAPRQLCPGIPRDLETIILKSIAREPDVRYASADELASDLRCFLEDRPIRARRATLTERIWRWSRRNPALAALSGTAAALLIAVAVTATVAYVQTNRANAKVRDALDGEKTQRLKAEANSALAIEALDTIFEQFAPAQNGAVSTFTVDDGAGTKINVPIQPVLSRESAILLEHMLGFYRQLAEQEDADPAIRYKIAEANCRVGDIHYRLGHLENARVAYSRSIQLLEQIEADRGATPTTRVELARINNKLGTTLIDQEQREEGRAFYRQAREILETLQPTSSNLPDLRFELARTCYLLAKVPSPTVPALHPKPEADRRPLPDGMSPPPPGMHGPPRRGRRPPGGLRPRHDHLNRVDDSWSRAVEILTELSNTYPDVPDYRHLLAICYRDLPPPIPFSSDNHPSPRDAKDLAIEILRQLVDDFPDVPEYRYDLCETYAMAAGPALQSSFAPATLAEQRLRDALNISEQLVAEHPNIPTYVVSQVHIRLRLAGTLQRLDQPGDAEQHLQKARVLQAGLARRFPEMPSHLVFVASLDGTLAGFMSKHGRLDEALAHLETALDVLDRIPDDWQRPPYVREVFIRTYMDIADVQRSLGNDSAAADAVRQAKLWRTER